MQWLRKSMSVAAAMLMSLNLMASASFAANGQQTTVIPVTLTVVHSVNNIDVTLPAAFPVSVIDGKVLTATNVDIKNNASKNDVEITSIQVTDGAYKVSDYNNFPNNSSSRIALSINNCSTVSSGALSIDKKSFPNIKAGETLAIDYKAKVSDSETTNKINAANVIITLKAID